MSGRIQVFGGVVVAMVALGAAPAAADCVDEFQEAWRAHEDVRPHLSEAEQRDFQTLRRAAGVLNRADRDDACEKVAEAVEDMLERRRAELVEQGVVLTRSEEERRTRLEAARPLTALGTTVGFGDLLGVEVINPAGEGLGEVEDVLVDAGANNLSYLVIERGGFLGMGEYRIAVPADRLRVTEDGDTLLLDMSEEAFKQAPEYAGRDTALNAEWRQRNDAFFGGTPAQQGEQKPAPAKSGG